MIRNFVVSGCSFTAGSSSIDEGINNPSVWSHFLLDQLSPKVYINLGISGGSNNSSMDSLTFYLESKKWLKPTDTLIGLNLTGLDRISTMCPLEHPDRNIYFSYAPDLGFNWITEGSFVAKISPFNGSLQKNIGYENIKILSSISIVQGITYLERYNFPYFFMLMNDSVFDEAPTWLQDFLNCRRKNWIQFDNSSNMYEFVRDNHWLREDKFHPNIVGQQEIASHIFKALKNNRTI